jgi:cell division transport system permease protein
MADLDIQPRRARREAYLEHHFASLHRSLKGLTSAPLASLMTIGVLAIALALPAAFLIAVEQIRAVTKGFERPGTLSVFLRASTSTEDQQRLLKILSVDPKLASVELKSPQQALEEFKAQSRLGDAVALLKDNPLPPVMKLTAAPAERSPERMAALARALGERSQVDYVSFDQRWVERFSGMLQIAERLTFLVGLMLALAVLLVVGNTIRLEIQERVEEIEISKLLGATDAFVRRPFLYAGVWLGLLGGVLAWALLNFALYALREPVAELARSYGSTFAIGWLPLATSLKLLLVSALIGWLGAWLAAGRQLSKITLR